MEAKKAMGLAGVGPHLPAPSWDAEKRRKGDTGNTDAPMSLALSRVPGGAGCGGERSAGDLAMYKPTLDQVRAVAGQGNLIPIYRELPADLETPVSVYLKLRDNSPSFLLESVEKGEQLGRYSFIGVQAPISLTRGRQVMIEGVGGAVLEVREADDPLDVVKEVLAQRLPINVPGLPRFIGGAVGYLAYDWVRFVEQLPETATDELDLPTSSSCWPTTW